MSNPAPDTWSFDLPSQLKLAIADAVTLFSKLDSCILETIWAVEQPDLERKKKLARGHASENFKAIEKIVSLIPGATTDAIWPALRDLLAERNLIAHGVWLVDDKKQSFVVWHSKMLESLDHVTGEHFTYRRFDYFLERAEHLLKTFSEFKKLLEKALTEETSARSN